MPASTACAIYTASAKVARGEAWAEYHAAVGASQSRHPSRFRSISAELAIDIARGGAR